AMDDLRDGIGLRAYGQRDPLLEYKFEAFEMFQSMIESIKEDVVRILTRMEVQPGLREPQRRRVAVGAREESGMVPALAVAAGAPEGAGLAGAPPGAVTEPAGGRPALRAARRGGPTAGEPGGPPREPVRV